MFPHLDNLIEPREGEALEIFMSKMGHLLEIDREIPVKSNKLPNLNFFFGFQQHNRWRSIFHDGPSRNIFRLHVIHDVINLKKNRRKTRISHIIFVSSE